MRRVMCRPPQAPDELRIEDVESPRPGPGQVRLRVEAAGVNYVDALLIGGRHQSGPTTPFTPGSEVAGRLDEIGPGVQGWAVGDRVVAGLPRGGYAEQVVVDATCVHAIPEGLASPTAATVTQSYGAVHFALFQRAALQPGSTVLVLGAGGGIGLAAVDLATSAGCTVIAAASSAAKLRNASVLGASVAIDYSSEDLRARIKAEAPAGVDVVIDPVGGTLAEPALRSLGSGGTYLVIGFASGSIPTIPLNQVLLNNRNVLGVVWDGDQRDVARVLAMVGAGTIHPLTPVTRPFTEVRSVLRELLDRRISGKVALVP
jgi:NADPH2:quinone reductase